MMSFLVRAIGGQNSGDVKDIFPRLQQAIERLDIPKKVWVLKASTAKRLLKALPPKHVMKQLGYRSVDSLIKRESIGEIFGAMRLCESAKWLEKFIHSYKQLKPTDFEMRDVEVIHITNEKWQKMAYDYVYQKRHNITHLKELGVILMLPLPVDNLPGITITMFPLLLHYINEMRVYSAFFKFKQVNPHFGDILVQTLLNDPPAAAMMGGQPIHWRVIQRYFGKYEHDYHPEIFEPHVQAEDLIWRRAEDLLFRLEPALLFWQDLDYVGIMRDGRPVSFNLMDMAVSYCNQLPYGQQVVYHMRESLWNEVFIRYLGQKTLERQVLKQLDNEVIAPEMFALIGSN